MVKFIALFQEYVVQWYELRTGLGVRTDRAVAELVSAAVAQRLRSFEHSIFFRMLMMEQHVILFIY
jgi:hypothetical protein